MMKFSEKMQARYTVKRYDPTSKVSAATLAELKEILHLSPSSTNSQPWNFVFVTDAAIREKLAEASYFNKEKIQDCTCLIVFRVIRNVADFEAQNNTYNMPGSIQYYDNFLKPLGDVHIRYWMSQQVYLSLGVLLAACAAMGIDSTPMEGIKTEVYDDILGDQNYETLFAVCIGKRADDDQNQPGLRPKTRLPIENILVEL